MVADRNGFGALLVRDLPAIVPSDGCKDVGKLADAMLALAAGPVHARRSRQPVRPTVLQSMLQHEGAAVKCAARRQIREYLVMFDGWK